MQNKTSFIFIMSFVLVGVAACARREQQPRSEQAASAWRSEPSYGAEPSRVSTEEERAQRESRETEDLDTLGAQDEAARQQRTAEACPVSVEGAEVQSREVPNGVALVFTTEGDVDELRARVDRFAQLHNEQSATPMPSGREERGEHAMHHGMVPSRAEVEEIDRGAQIILTPRDPGQLSALRQDAERSAQQMSGGECPVMGSQAGG